MSEKKLDETNKFLSIVCYKVFNFLQGHGLLKANWSEHIVEKELRIGHANLFAQLWELFTIESKFSNYFTSISRLLLTCKHVDKFKLQIWVILNQFPCRLKLLRFCKIPEQHPDVKILLEIKRQDDFRSCSRVSIHNHLLCIYFKLLSACI